MSFWFASLLLFATCLATEFNWNGTSRDFKVTFWLRHSIKKCRTGKFQAISIYAYEGSLDDALLVCGQACIENREDLVDCNGIIIVSDWLCQTVSCPDPVFKKQNRKSRQARKMMFISP
jgi:chloramphenicol 3-O-phosphotransferase